MLSALMMAVHIIPFVECLSIGWANENGTSNALGILIELGSKLRKTWELVQKKNSIQ